MKGFRILYKDTRLPHLDSRSYVEKDGHVVTFPSVEEALKVQGRLEKLPFVRNISIVDSENLEPVPIEPHMKQDVAASVVPTPTSSPPPPPPPSPSPATKAKAAPKSKPSTKKRARSVCPDCGRPISASLLKKISG